MSRDIEITIIKNGAAQINAVVTSQRECRHVIRMVELLGEFLAEDEADRASARALPAEAGGKARPTPDSKGER